MSITALAPATTEAHARPLSRSDRKALNRALCAESRARYGMTPTIDDLARMRAYVEWAGFEIALFEVMGEQACEIGRCPCPSCRTRD